MFSFYNAVGKGLNIMGSFDLITPLWSVIQHIRNGPAYTFFIRWDLLDGRSANDVQKLLRQHGVRTWGLLVHFNTMMISVPKQQAAWASYLLERENIPVENPITSSAARARRDLSASRPSREAQRISWLDRLLTVVDRLDVLLP